VKTSTEVSAKAIQKQRERILASSSGGRELAPDATKGRRPAHHAGLLQGGV
jgi:hypothetical protein